jgi:hypothetical protein
MPSEVEPQPLFFALALLAAPVVPLAAVAAPEVATDPVDPPEVELVGATHRPASQVPGLQQSELLLQR